MKRLSKDIERENSSRNKREGLTGKALDRRTGFDNMIDKAMNRNMVNVDKVNGSGKASS